MKLDNVLYDNGKPYIVRIRKDRYYRNGNGVKEKHFGVIKKCIQCNKDFFADNSSIKRGWGVLCDAKCRTNYFSGDRVFGWQGGKANSGGYIMIYLPKHPLASKYGYVLEHRLIIQTVVKRELKSNEHIHHINSIKNDNRIENLKIMSRSEHMRLHRLQDLSFKTVIT